MTARTRYAAKPGAARATTRTTATRTMSPPDSALSGMCFLRAFGCRPACAGSAEGHARGAPEGSVDRGRGVIVSEVTDGADVHDVLLLFSHAVNPVGPWVCLWV